MAMGSVPVLESLLALSATSLDPSVELGFRDWEELPSTPGESGMDIINSLLIKIFDSLRRFTARSPTSWQSPFDGISFPSLNSALFHERHPSVSLAISWAMLRLGKWFLPPIFLLQLSFSLTDVSVGLLTSSPVSIPDLLPYGVASLETGFVRDSLRFAREPLFFCARVLNHCFGQEMAPLPDVSLGPAKSQSWKVLFESLNFWYTNRPQEYKPVLELDASDQLFQIGRAHV